MKYADAREIATSVLKRLEPFCTRIDVAGSCRREKEDCRDLEICCVPRITEIKDLFGELQESQRDINFVNCAASLEKIIKGDLRTGRYVQIDLWECIKLDLFIPVETDYIRQWSIRTGSSLYSHKILATAWVRKGWVGTENGLRLQKESYGKDLGNGKTKWICNSPNPTLPPIFNNELELFEWLQIPWLEPSKRNV